MRRKFNRAISVLPQPSYGAWRAVYARFEAEGAAGSQIADRMFFRIPMFYKAPPAGAVLVAEDKAGVTQAITRLRTCSSGFFVEELLVAPWNNAHCVKTLGDISAWSSKQEELVELAKIHKIELKELVRPNPGSGTCMMLAVCLYATALKVDKISLTSLRESIPFYWSLGMKQPDEEGKDFYYDLKGGIPKELKARVAKYFPGLALL